jgi:RNase adapter protein RapZ
MDRLVVITGLAGSGKTLAADCLEDLGYYCVDNLPVSLIPPFCDLIQRGRDRVGRAALVIDAREGRYLEQFPEILQQLRLAKVPVHLLLLECSDEVLKRRFSESRRPHPMARNQDTLEQAIARERAALAPLREVADRIVDTSRFTTHELRSFLKNTYDTSVAPTGPRLHVISFGFKYGLPTEADLVFDVRFLPNPYFDDELRPLDGRDERVQGFLDRIDLTHLFMERLSGMLEFLIPLYAKEGKSYLTVAIGCTGGKHRSVALVEKLAARIGHADRYVSVAHRDLGRE